MSKVIKDKADDLDGGIKYYTIQNKIPEKILDIFNKDRDSEEEKTEPKIFKKRKRKIEPFEYISKKRFEDEVEEYNKELPEDEQITVVGDFKYWRRNKRNKEKTTRNIIGNLLVKSAKKESKDELEEIDEFEVFYLYKPKKRRTKGYAYVGDNQFVRIRKRCFLPLLLLLLFGILMMLFLFNPNVQDKKEQIKIEDASDYEEDDAGVQPEVEYTEIPGYVDKEYSADNPILKLYNPADNTVYFQYVLSENGEVFYQTDWILPNKMVEYNVYENLSAGSHDITITINTCDIETYAVCSGANQEITININK